MSRVVIIHQAGTMDLVYNKGRDTGLSTSNKMLKLAGHMRY